MKTKIYSVFDSKAAAFGVPFFSANDGTAVRSFGDLVNDKRAVVVLHPEDYSLFCLGEFDDYIGDINSFKPTNLITASAMVKPETEHGNKNFNEYIKEVKNKLGEVVAKEIA